MRHYYTPIPRNSDATGALFWTEEFREREYMLALRRHRDFLHEVGGWLPQISSTLKDQDLPFSTGEMALLSELTGDDMDMYHIGTQGHSIPGQSTYLTQQYGVCLRNPETTPEIIANLSRTVYVGTGWELDRAQPTPMHFYTPRKPVWTLLWLPENATEEDILKGTGLWRQGVTGRVMVAGQVTAFNNGHAGFTLSGIEGYDFSHDYVSLPGFESKVLGKTIVPHFCRHLGQ